MKTILTPILSLCLIAITYSQGPPITVNTPVMLGLGGSGIRIIGKFISKENSTIYVNTIGIPYNISPKFQVGGLIPFKFINPKGTDYSSGFSDLSLFAKYQLYKKDETAKTFRILTHLKQSVPTGKTNSTPPIGTGFYQTYLGLIIGSISTKTGIYGDVGYQFSGNHSTDIITYNSSIGVPLFPITYPQNQLNTYLELNGEYIIDTKSHILSISPGLQFIPGKRILFETSFQLPITQRKIKSEKTNYSLLLGTRILLN